MADQGTRAGLEGFDNPSTQVVPRIIVVLTRTLINMYTHEDTVRQEACNSTGPCCRWYTLPTCFEGRQVTLTVCLFSSHLSWSGRSATARTVARATRKTSTGFVALLTRARDRLEN